MCGRFTQQLTWREIHDLYRLAGSALPMNLAPRYNGAPTQNFAACRLDEAGSRVIAKLRWELVPSWRRTRGWECASSTPGEPAGSSCGATGTSRNRHSLGRPPEPVSVADVAVGWAATIEGRQSKELLGTCGTFDLRGPDALKTKDYIER